MRYTVSLRDTNESHVSTADCYCQEVRSASTTLRALEIIAAHQPLGVSELARKLEVPKPTAQRAIQALAETHWIRRSDTHSGRWVLTPKSMDVASHIGQELGLREAALPTMTELAAATTESTHLAVPDRCDIVVIDGVESTQVVRIHWPVGRRSPAYASANGKAILAAMPRDCLSDHLPRRLKAFTPQTITDRQQLLVELDATAKRGYSIQRGELRTDVASLAAAVCPQPNRPIASLSIFIPIQRFPEDEEERLGGLVKAASDEVAVRMASRISII